MLCSQDDPWFLIDTRGPRAELRKVIPNQTYRYPEIASWCRGNALSFVRNFIERHDTEHAMLLQMVEQAKQ